MKHIITLSITLLLNLSVQAQKRGLAYGHHSPEDLDVLSPHVSWWYNWSETPDSQVADSYEDHGFEFVPMTWDENFNETKLRDFLTAHPETKYLLAFNEPNFLEQANMKPSEVAVLWPTLESIADDFDLKIVGPAVNYCGGCVTENGTTYNDPVKYLDDFFAACSDCRVDHIAVHTYVNTIGALEWYIGLFEKYNKPIWLTEFAGWEENGVVNNVNDQVGFMESALEFLDNEPTVFRYAWFIGRTSGGISQYPYIDILGTNGKLTTLGEVYAAEPFVRDPNKVVDIPAVIYAEDYNYMEGISLEKTQDIYGDKNIGYIDAGDWLEYKINVVEDGDMNIHFRFASTSSSSLKVLIDGVETLTQSLPNNGGWQNWETISNTITLTAGKHDMRIVAVSAGFNFNWIGMGELPAVPITPDSPVLNSQQDQESILIYPSPANETVTVEATDYDKVQIISLSGKVVYSSALTPQPINTLSLPSGAYVIVLTNPTKVTTRKLFVR